MTLRRISDARRHVVVLANPKAGSGNRGGKVGELRGLLERDGYFVEILQGVEQFRDTVMEVEQAGQLRTVVAAGGDGTVGLVVNTIPPEVPVCVLPLGTENLLSKFFEMSPAVSEVNETIDEGQVVALDAGRANGRLFFLMIGCGFDAEVVRRLHSNRTGNINHWSYAKPIMDSIRKYNYPEVSVYIEHPERAPETIEAKWAFVVNLPRYAGGLRLVPDASGTDGLLDVCTFRQGSLWDGLRYLAGVVFGQHQSLRDCHIVQASRVRIESEGNVPIQLDGDPAGSLPVNIDVLPGRLQMLAPKKWIERHEQ